MSMVQEASQPFIPLHGILKFIIGIQLIYIAVLMFQIYSFHTHTIPPLSQTQAMGIANKDNTQAPQNNSQLAEIVKSSLAQTHGTYGIYIKNLKTNEGYQLNEHQEFSSGSLYKLWIMGTVFQQEKQGILHDDDDLKADVAHLNDVFNIDDEDAEMTSGTLDFTIGSAVTQMITISHNYAALALTEKVKLSNVSHFLSQNGFSESSVGGANGPQTTASDIGEFYQKLYDGKIVDASSSASMMDLLKHQQLNDKMPKYLPKTVSIAHKTGEIGMFSHDAGIIYAPKGPYIFVVLSNTDNPPAAEERIALLSKDVFAYFNQ